MDKSISRDYDKNLQFFREKLGDGISFDLIIREIKICGKRSALICFDGLVKDEALTEIMQSLYLLKKELFKPNIKSLIEHSLPYIEMELESKIDKLNYAVLSGSIILIVDSFAEAFVIDARTYPARNPEEPDIERVVRGSRDGFTETIVFNTALIRRRIRDPGLRMELLTMGNRSQTDICLAYINDISNPELINEIREKIQSVSIDGIPMAEKSVEELIIKGNAWNPFPKVRYTERPDVAATHLFEGHVLIMVDTSPSVMIAPAGYLHHIQHAEEYRQNPLVGVYIRWVRILAIIASVFVTPFWLLFALSPELLPEALKFIGPKEVGNVPIFIQFIIADLSLDLMRMAAIHTPSPLATALGVIAALLIGDIAISIGLFIPEVILYTAVVAVGSYSTPSYELAMANRMVRLFLLVATGFFQLYGFIASCIIVLLLLIFTRSFNMPYLWPLIPFNYRAFKSILIRSPIPVQDIRPEILKPIDNTRQKNTLKKGGRVK